MDLTYIPVFLMAGLLAFILIAPLMPGEMPNFRDRRKNRR